MFVAPSRCSHPAAPQLRAQQWRVVRSAQSYSGDEFQAARDRIRRIQLGLGPNDPLPPEEDMEAPPVATEEAAEGKNTTEDAVNGTGFVEAVDAYAGTEKEMMEVADMEGLKKGAQESNLFSDLAKLPGQLIEDLRIVTTPSLGELAQTFGIVVALVIIYTGFIAVVDALSQTAFSQVFEEWYKAARPDDSM